MKRQRLTFCFVNREWSFDSIRLMMSSSPTTTTTEEKKKKIIIPAFAQPLAPYIKPRQEILQIRRALTVYLGSLIHGSTSEEQKNHLGLALGLGQEQQHDVIIPPEVTGLRREYLQALQENSMARKKYAHLLQRATTTENQQSDDSEIPTDQQVLDSYVELCNVRQRYAKARIFRHYLDELLLSKQNELGEDHSSATTNYPSHVEVHEEREDDHEELLMHRLEKAVLQAKGHLDREKGLLEEQQLLLKPSTSSSGSGKRRVLALQRTRDELVRWVEDKLASCADEEDRQEEEESTTTTTTTTMTMQLNQRRELIDRQYAMYVKARKDMLDHVHAACQPVSDPSLGPRKSSGEYSK